MSDSSAYAFQLSIEDLKGLQTTLSENGSELSDAIKLCVEIAASLEESNPALARGWTSIGKNLQFFSENMGKIIGDIYDYISTQMSGITQAESQQGEVINEYIAQGDKLISEIMAMLGQTISDPNVASTVTSTTSQITTSLADSVNTVTGQMAPVVATGVVQATNTMVPLIVDLSTKATGLVTNSIAEGIGRMSPASGDLARTLASGFNVTAGEIYQALGDGVVATTGQVAPILASQAATTTGRVVQAIASGINSTAGNAVQAAGSLAAHASAGTGADVI